MGAGRQNEPCAWERGRFQELRELKKGLAQMPYCLLGQGGCSKGHDPIRDSDEGREGRVLPLTG